MTTASTPVRPTLHIPEPSPAGSRAMPPSSAANAGSASSSKMSAFDAIDGADLFADLPPAQRQAHLSDLLENAQVLKSIQRAAFTL
jgi:hypothetical protein